MLSAFLFEAETKIKYSGYINRQKAEIEKTKIYEDMIIPKDFDYNKIKSISNESREKLLKILMNFLFLIGIYLILKLT